MIKWQTIEEMTGLEACDIFMLRQQVFMLEQDCLYQDIDSSDITALHCRYFDDKHRLVGYLRILPPTSTSDLSIGRVAVKKKFRGTGVGREMMESALDVSQQRFPSQKIRIAAQSYLTEFYSSLGFTEIGRGYVEDDIPHQDMIFNY